MRSIRLGERFFYFSPSAFCLRQKPPPSEREGIRVVETPTPTTGRRVVAPYARNGISMVGRGLAPAVSAPSERGLSNA